MSEQAKGHNIDVKDEEEIEIPEQKSSKKAEKKKSPAEIMQDEIDSLKAQLKESEEKVLRNAAEYENIRKRLLKETDDRLKYSNQVLLESMLPVIDNLELAFNHSDSGADNASLRQGVELTMKQFLEVLGKFGLTAVDAGEGVEFDPTYHDALMLDSREDLENNVVTMVLQKGFKLHDRVIRPAKVKVNKK